MAKNIFTILLLFPTKSTICTKTTPFFFLYTHLSVSYPNHIFFPRLSSYLNQKNSKTQVSHTKNPIFPAQLLQFNSKPLNHIYILNLHQILCRIDTKKPQIRAKKIFTFGPAHLPHLISVAASKLP